MIRPRPLPVEQREILADLTAEVRVALEELAPIAAGGVTDEAITLILEVALPILAARGGDDAVVVE